MIDEPEPGVVRVPAVIPRRSGALRTMAPVHETAAGLTAARRKELGAFYTPPAMAAQLVRWAVRRPTDSVLDPSFGGLVFLAAAYDRLRGLGVREPDTREQIFGGELDSRAYASGLGDPHVGGSTARLVHGDFLSVTPGAELPLVDAVVGNPPYVRYQGFNASGTQGHDLAARVGVRLTRLASSWAPFVVHGTSFLKTGGRMAQVLPAEILHAQYAKDVLGYLRRSFAAVTLVLFERRVFPDALEEVVLLLAEGRAVHPADGVHVVEVADLGALDVDRLPRPNDSPMFPVAEEDDTLLLQLLPDATRDLYRELRRRPDVASLGSVASVDIGAVTGANDFFLVPGNDARVPERFLRPAVSKAAHIAGTRFTRVDHQRLSAKGKPMHMVVIDRDHPEGGLADVEGYLALGDASGISDRYKCRVRSPWWSVPLPKHGAPAAFMTYCSSEHPRVVVNEVGALHTNTVHGLTPLAALDAAEIAARFINSLTLLSVELVGRSYGGGVLKLEPTEAEAALLPVAGKRLAPRLGEIDEALRRGNLRDVLDVIDPLVLSSAGLGLRDSQIARLRDAAEKLRARRSARGRAPQPEQLTL